MDMFCLESLLSSQISYLAYGILSSQRIWVSIRKQKSTVQGQNLRSDRRAAELAGLTQVASLERWEWDVLFCHLGVS